MRVDEVAGRNRVSLGCGGRHTDVMAAKVGRCRLTISSPPRKRLELSARNQNMMNCFQIYFKYAFNINLRRFTKEEALRRLFETVAFHQAVVFVRRPAWHGRS